MISMALGQHRQRTPIIHSQKRVYLKQKQDGSLEAPILLLFALLHTSREGEGQRCYDSSLPLSRDMAEGLTLS